MIVRRLTGGPGFACPKPAGAFYAFPRYAQKIKSHDFALKLVEHGLICTPGSAFGSMGENHLRFSYACTTDQIEKGMDVLEKVAKTISG